MGVTRFFLIIYYKVPLSTVGSRVFGCSISHALECFRFCYMRSRNWDIKIVEGRTDCHQVSTVRRGRKGSTWLSCDDRLNRIAPVEPSDLFIDLLRRKELSPFMKQEGKHSVWAQFVYFAEATINRKFIVRHSHVNLITLDLIVCNRLKLSSWRCAYECFQKRHVKGFRCPKNEPLQIRF